MTKHTKKTFNCKYWGLIEKNRTTSWENIASVTGMSLSGIFDSIRHNRPLNIEQTWRLAELFSIRLDDLSVYNNRINVIPVIEISFDQDVPFADRFWHTVNTIRKSQMISWAKVGEKADIPASTISSAKTSNRIISFEFASEIINAGLNCSLDHVLDLMYCKEKKIKEDQKRTHEMAVNFMRLSVNDQNMVSNLISRLLDK